MNLTSRTNKLEPIPDVQDESTHNIQAASQTVRHRDKIPGNPFKGVHRGLVAS